MSFITIKKRLLILRSLLSISVYPLMVLVFAILIVLFGVSPYFRLLQDRLVGAWAQCSLWIFGVKVKVQNVDRIPKEGYLALFNHTSNFDILAIQSLIHSIRFGAKIELFRVPFFGAAMRASGALPISRGNLAEVLQVYEQAKKRIKEGECFILSPEGTRQPTEKLGPFKSGPFLLAIAAQCPIVPIAVRGASQIQPKGKILPNIKDWISTIEVIVGEPILTMDLGDTDKKELQNTVREAFNRLGVS